eukprot:COSAG06_NODE_16583_length_992_cov_3.008959_3_plen_72_part_00
MLEGIALYLVEYVLFREDVEACMWERRKERRAKLMSRAGKTVLVARHRLAAQKRQDKHYLDCFHTTLISLR